MTKINTFFAQKYEKVAIVALNLTKKALLAETSQLFNIFLVFKVFHRQVIRHQEIMPHNIQKRRKRQTESAPKHVLFERFGAVKTLLMVKHIIRF